MSDQNVMKFNNRIIPFAFVGYEFVYSQLGATRLPGGGGGGHSHITKGRDAHREISIEPLKGTNLGVC